MGLEPTTFCMARSPREPSRNSRSRQAAWNGGSSASDLSGARSNRRARLTRRLTKAPDGPAATFWSWFRRRCAPA